MRPESRMLRFLTAAVVLRQRTSATPRVIVAARVCFAGVLFDEGKYMRIDLRKLSFAHHVLFDELTKRTYYANSVQNGEK